MVNGIYENMDKKPINMDKKSSNMDINMDTIMMYDVVYGCNHRV